MIINYMLELIFKANAMIDLINPSDSLKLLEMTINKTDIMLEKSKLVVIKIDKLFIAMPVTLTKVETKLRNVFINEKPKMDGLAKFMQFYLATFVSPVVSSSHGNNVIKPKEERKQEAAKQQNIIKE